MSTPVSARSSDSMDDLTSDLHHLKTLVRLITNLAIDIVDADKTQCEQTKKEVSEVVDLLWIARDMVETLAENGEAAHRRVIKEQSKTHGGAS